METKETAANSKRRRGLGIVTPNACTECRKKRAKCDGQKPCRRCVAQTAECIYEVPVRQSKETMRSQIEHLRQEQQRSQLVLAALISTDTSDQILRQLRNGETIEGIADEIDIGTGGHRQSSTLGGNNVTTYAENTVRKTIGTILRPAIIMEESSNIMCEPAYQDHDTHNTSIIGGFSSLDEMPNDFPQEDSMKWETEIPLSSSGENSLFPTVGKWNLGSVLTSTLDSTTKRARMRGQKTILGKQFGFEEFQDTQTSNFNRSWTIVSSDIAFIEHLMALYFCWEYPTFASLSKEHFLEDFRTGESRRCSPLLVNALLALGCRFSDEPSARTDPSDRTTAGDHFFAEATRLLKDEEDCHILTTIQALGLMSIREASCGRSNESIYYSGQSIRLAVEMGLHLRLDHDRPDEESETNHAVRSATFWGAFSLDEALSLSIGRLPTFSKDMNLVTKPEIVDDIEASSWIPYTDDGAPTEKSCTQPSNVRSVCKTFCELSEYTHKSLYSLYAPAASISSTILLSCYHDYLQWYDAIPSTLRLGHNFTPAVLFAHMHYHFAILSLFRPFIKLEVIGSGVSPRDVCSQAADAISALVRSYSQLYTLQRTPSFVPYFVLSSSISHIVTYENSPKRSQQLLQGIADLKQMTRCHRFANRALSILYFLIHHWQINIKLEDQGEIDYENICQPHSTSFDLFSPYIADIDMISGIGPAEKPGNPLFWPFPMQGRPLLNIDATESAGFRVLAS